MSRAAVRNDLAACVLTRRVTTIKPACVGKPLQKGQPVLYAGYGLNNQGESVFYDGKQRQGILPLLRRVGGIITTYSRNVKEMMDAAIGSGDSGGFTGKKDEMGQLWISGVVSASTSEKAGESSDPVMNEDSYNSSVDLASATSQRFLTSFTREKGVEICGIGESSPEPTPPSPNFTPTPGPSLTPAPTPSVTSAPREHLRPRILLRFRHRRPPLPPKLPNLRPRIPRTKTTARS